MGATTEHTAGCIVSKCLADEFSFTPGCPLCQLQKAAPQLLEACRELFALLKMVEPDILKVLAPNYQHYVKEYLERAEAAIAAAEVKE